MGTGLAPPKQHAVCQEEKETETGICLSVRDSAALEAKAVAAMEAATACCSLKAYAVALRASSKLKIHADIRW